MDITDDINIIMDNNEPKVIIREILKEMDAWRVSHIRQRLNGKWSDNFYHSLFELWYANGINEHSGARAYFQDGGSFKTAGESLMVKRYICNLCSKVVDGDDLLLNHFRNGHCTRFNKMVNVATDEPNFWAMMRVFKNK